MTFTQLEEILNEHHIKSSAYKINETPCDNTYCILYDGKFTEVFYFERGIRCDLKTFQNKDEGINYFLYLILNDKTTRTDWDNRV